MAKYEEHNKLDFRQGGDTLHQFAEKYMNEITRVFAYLNEVRGNEAGSIEPTANQIKIENNKIYVRDSDNVEWVLLGESKPNFGFKDADEAFISTKELSVGKVDDINNIDFSKIITKDDLTQTGEVGKIPYVNNDGLLPISVDGNAALIGGIRTEFNNLSDGQVLTFRSESNTWRNEPKGAIGSGKALAIYQGDTLLAQYDGSQSTSVDITGLADKHIAEHNLATDAHADIRDAIPKKISELQNDAGYISYAPVSTLEVVGEGNAVGDISCENGMFKATKASFITAHQDISGKADKVSIAAGTAGNAANSSGQNITIPFVNVNSQGVVTGYGTKQHTVTGFVSSVSPSFTGTPTTSNPSEVSNGSQIASTAFVRAFEFINWSAEYQLPVLGTDRVTLTHATFPGYENYGQTIQGRVWDMYRYYIPTDCHLLVAVPNLNTQSGDDFTSAGDQFFVAIAHGAQRFVPTNQLIPFRGGTTIYTFGNTSGTSVWCYPFGYNASNLV